MMPHYIKTTIILFALLTSVKLHAQVSGVDYCYQPLTDEQAYSLRIMMNDYGVSSCERLFAKAATMDGMRLNGSHREREATDASPLCAMSHLTTVTFRDTAIADFSCLANLPLKQLLIHNSNEITLDIRFMAQLTDLEMLIMYGSPVADFSPLQYLENLTYLDLSHRNMEDTTPLATLLNLEILTLRGNPLQNLEGLRNLPKVRQLDLQKTGLQSDDLEMLRHLTTLTILNLNENALDDIRALTQLTNLISLDMKNNQVQDLTPLRNMEKLKELDARDNQIEAVTAIAYLPELSRLNLDGNQIKDTSSLVNLPKLSRMMALRNPLYECAPSYGTTSDRLKEGKLCSAADLKKYQSWWYKLMRFFSSEDK